MTTTTRAIPPLQHAQQPPASIGERASADAVYRKVGWRLIPLLFLCYIVAYLDRVNVGFAKLQMQGDLQLSEAVSARQHITSAMRLNVASLTLVVGRWTNTHSPSTRCMRGNATPRWTTSRPSDTFRCAKPSGMMGRSLSSRRPP